MPAQNRRFPPASAPKTTGPPTWQITPSFHELIFSLRLHPAFPFSAETMGPSLVLWPIGTIVHAWSASRWGCSGWTLVPGTGACWSGWSWGCRRLWETGAWIFSSVISMPSGNRLWCYRPSATTNRLLRPWWGTGYSRSYRGRRQRNHWQSE